MRAPILAALVLAACGDTAIPPGFSSGSPVTSAPESTSGSSSTGDASSTGPADVSTSSSDSSSTGILRDVGTAMDFGPVQPEGCKGKVDILIRDLAPRHDGDRADAAPRQLPTAVFAGLLFRHRNRARRYTATPLAAPLRGGLVTGLGVEF